MESMINSDKNSKRPFPTVISRKKPLDGWKDEDFQGSAEK
jgi:hypothetical protein